MGHGWAPDTHKQCSASLALQKNTMLEPYMFLTGEQPEYSTYACSNVYILVLVIRLAAQFSANMNLEQSSQDHLAAPLAGAEGILQPSPCASHRP